jgi:uncharacterized membrane protein YidH (DUF202 family)
MEPSESKAVPKQRMSRLSCWSFLSWILAAALGSISFYLDHYAPYRGIRGYPKDKIENQLLQLAILLAFAGIILAISAIVSIQKSRGSLKGGLLAVIGMVLSLITMVVCGFELFVKLLMDSMPT